VGKWPLVGRGKELAQLTAAVAAGRGAVVTGPAGVGKTALAMRCLRVAGDRGMPVARATATRASRGLLFGALAPFLPPGPDGEGLSGENHGELLRRYVRAVAGRAAAGRPLVVFVDDAHLLDDGSATLVQQLALTRAATVLVTVRLGEAAPDPVVALWKDGPAERIEVRALDGAEVEELLGGVLGGPVDVAAVRQLTGRCRGNPLFLRELVSGALESGALAEEGGIWQLRGALRPTARLVELVAGRLGDLSGPERAALELVTLGEPLGQGELAALAEPAAVGALERKGLIASSRDGRRVQVRLAHPVYGDVVRAGIGVLREQAITRSLAGVIEAAGARRREDALLLASLRLTGGGGSAALLEAGAVAARARHDYALTERLARAAISEGAGADACYAAAEAAHFQGRYEQAERELAALAAASITDTQRVQVALLRFDNAFLFRGPQETGLRLINDAADAIADQSWRGELLGRRSFFLGLRDGPRVAVEAGSALLQRSGSGPFTVAHVAVSHSLVRLGRLDDVLGLLTPPPGSGAIPAADESWDRWALFAARAAALVYAGRLHEAGELLAAASSRVVTQPAAEANAFIAMASAALHFEQGRVHSASRRASESYVLFQKLGRRFVARRSYVYAALGLAFAGQAGRAAEALAAYDAAGIPAALLYETDLAQARAWTAAAAGDFPSARRQLEAAAGLGEEIGDLIGAASALHGLARLGQAGKVSARLAALAGQVDGDLVAARAAYAAALAAADSEALGRAGGDFEDLGALLYAAEASAEAAVLLRRAGETRRAAAAEQKAVRLLTCCEGAATPPVAAITARVRLTRGELDTAMQAATGRSNKQIAAEMHLSVRTVESHLQRAYGKLGIPGRHELADALRDVSSAGPVDVPSFLPDHFEGSRGGHLRSRRHAWYQPNSHNRISYPYTTPWTLTPGHRRVTFVPLCVHAVR
jgi:DNA-binding CsgD family transcriptional regulator